MGTIPWILRCTSSISILGSSCVVHMILSDQVKNLELPNNRISLSMSILNIFQSIAISLATLPAPRDSGLPGAIGNNASCTAQAFFIQIGFSVPLYNASLFFFYLLYIKYDVSRHQFSQKIEPLCHAISFLYPLGLGIAGIILDQFQAVFPVCWIDLLDRDKCCLLLFHAGSALIVSFLLILFSTISSFYSVKERESTMDIYGSGTGRHNGLTSQLNQERWDIMKQLQLHFIGFLFTYSWTFVLGICIWFHIKIPQAILVVAAISVPLQGMWNFFAFAQPTFKRLRIARPEKSFLWTIWHTVFPASINERSRHPIQNNDIQIHQNDTCTDCWSLEAPDSEQEDASFSRQSDFSTASELTEPSNNAPPCNRQFLGEDISTIMSSQGVISNAEHFSEFKDEYAKGHINTH